MAEKQNQPEKDLDVVMSHQEKVHREKTTHGFMGVKTAEVLIGQMGLENAHSFLAGIIFRMMSEEGVREAMLRVPFMQAEYDKNPLAGKDQDAEAEIIKINGHSVFLIEANTFYDLLNNDVSSVLMHWGEKDFEKLQTVVNSVLNLISGNFNLGVDTSRSLMCLSYGSMENTVVDALSKTTKDIFKIVAKAFAYTCSCVSKDEVTSSWLFKAERVLFGEETVTDYYLCRYNLLPVSDLDLDVDFSL